VRYEDWDSEEMPIKKVFHILGSQMFDTDGLSLNQVRRERMSMNQTLSRKRNRSLLRKRILFSMLSLIRGKHPLILW